MSRIATTSEALGSRLRFELARLHKRAHARTHYAALARRFPLAGRPLPELLQSIDRAQRRSPSHALIPLPSFEVRGARAYYAGRALPAIPQAALAAWSRFVLGEASEEERACLLDEGLLFEHAPSTAAAASLVLSPHQDDAALSIGGCLAARDERPTILDLYTVSGWTSAELGGLGVAEVSALRAREEALSAGVLGGTAIELGLWEVDLRVFHRQAVDGVAAPRDFRFRHDPALRSEAEHDCVRGALEAALRLQPARLYLPLGLGGHADHLSTRELGLHLLSRWTGRRPEVELYEDLPYAVTEEPQVERVVRALEARGLRLEPVLTDIGPVYRRKQQAIRAHRSQWDARDFGAAVERHACLIAQQAGLGAGRAERTWRVAA